MLAVARHPMAARRSPTFDRTSFLNPVPRETPLVEMAGGVFHYEVTMPNATLDQIDFRTGQAVLSAGGQRFTFPIKGVTPTPPALPPIVVDPTAAIAALKLDVDTRLDALLAAVQAGGTGGGGGGGGGTTDYFPADPGVAPFSPENSQIINNAGVIGGRPYLKDGEGTVHMLKAVAGLVYWFKGNNPWPTNVAEAPTISQIIVRQGQVFCQWNGIWKRWDPNGTVYNATLPPAWVSGGGTGGDPPLPPLPDLPAPGAIAPGSSGRTVRCGKGQAMATIAAGLAAAADGDTVVVSAGTYNEPIPTITKAIVLDCSGATLSGLGLTGQLAGGGKGLIVPRADHVLKNVVIRDVAMDQTSGQLTSAVRPDQGCGYLTMINVKCVANQCGVGAGGFPVVIEMTDCDISGNGLLSNSGSLTHNLYVGGECRRLKMTRVTSNGSNEAHAIKYRGPELIVEGGLFYAQHGSCFDLPNGTTVVAKISGAVIVKKAGDDDHKMLNHGEEGPSNGLAGILITGGSIQAGCDNPTFNGAGGKITLVGVNVTGNQITGTGVTIIGL